MIGNSIMKDGAIIDGVLRNDDITSYSDIDFSEMDLDGDGVVTDKDDIRDADDLEIITWLDSLRDSFFSNDLAKLFHLTTLAGEDLNGSLAALSDNDPIKLAFDCIDNNSGFDMEAFASLTDAQQTSLADWLAEQISNYNIGMGHVNNMLASNPDLINSSNSLGNVYGVKFLESIESIGGVLQAFVNTGSELDNMVFHHDTIATYTDLIAGLGGYARDINRFMNNLNGILGTNYGADGAISQAELDEILSILQESTNIMESLDTLSKDELGKIEIPAFLQEAIDNGLRINQLTDLSAKVGILKGWVTTSGQDSMRLDDVIEKMSLIEKGKASQTIVNEMFSSNGLYNDVFDDSFSGIKDQVSKMPMSMITTGAILSDLFKSSEKRMQVTRLKNKKLHQEHIAIINQKIASKRKQIQNK
ncbi:hypothetical protein ACFL4D_02620 [Candidatus Margulisiibacteriota bacterium]